MRRDLTVGRVTMAIGLLLPSRLDDIIPVVVHALRYDVRKGTTSVGT